MPTTLVLVRAEPDLPRWKRTAPGTWQWIPEEGNGGGGVLQAGGVGHVTHHVKGLQLEHERGAVRRTPRQRGDQGVESTQLKIPG